MWLIKASVFWWYFRLIIEHELIASAIKAHNSQAKIVYGKSYKKYLLFVNFWKQNMVFDSDSQTQK